MECHGAIYGPYCSCAGTLGVTSPCWVFMFTSRMKFFGKFFFSSLIKFEKEFHRV